MNANMAECPDDLRKRAIILYYNGIHGFQAPDDKNGVSLRDSFVICYVGGIDNVGKEDDADYHQLTIQLRKESKSETVTFGYWLNNDYLKIHWSEYPLIKDIFNALLRMKLSFTTRNHAEAHFDARVDLFFTFEEMERRSIANIRQLISLLPLYNQINDAFYEEWNYITPEGVRFCKEEMQKRSYYFARYDTERENYFQWELFNDYDKVTLLSNQSPSSMMEPVSFKEREIHDLSKTTTTTTTTTNDNKAATVVEGDNTCMICLEREANTMVLPCEHVVVCNTCSLQLEVDQSLSRDHCIKCRQHIEHKLY
jgi:hypothetical protein